MLVKSLIVSAALLFTGNAFANADCRFYMDEGNWISMSEDIGFAATGIWAYWECIEKSTGKARANVVFTRYDYATKQSIGGKLDTALKSLTAFQSSWTRNVTLSTTDVSLEEIRANFLSKYPQYVGKF